MEHFEGLDIFRQRGALVDDSFELFVLFFEGICSLSIFSDYFFRFYLNLLSEFSNLFILDDNSLIEIGS